MYCFRSQSKYSKTRVIVLFVWIMSCKVTIFACFNSRRSEISLNLCQFYFQSLTILTVSRYMVHLLRNQDEFLWGQHDFRWVRTFLRKRLHMCLHLIWHLSGKFLAFRNLNLKKWLNISISRKSTYLNEIFAPESPWQWPLPFNIFLWSGHIDHWKIWRWKTDISRKWKSLGYIFLNL